MIEIYVTAVWIFGAGYLLSRAIIFFMLYASLCSLESSKYVVFVRAGDPWNNNRFIATKGHRFKLAAHLHAHYLPNDAIVGGNLQKMAEQLAKKESTVR